MSAIALPALWRPRVPWWRLPGRGLDALFAFGAQRNPSTGGIKRSPTSGAAKKNTATIATCCCCGNHPIGACGTTGTTGKATYALAWSGVTFCTNCYDINTNASIKWTAATLTSHSFCLSNDAGLNPTTGCAWINQEDINPSALQLTRWGATGCFGGGTPSTYSRLTYHFRWLSATVELFVYVDFVSGAPGFAANDAMIFYGSASRDADPMASYTISNSLVLADCATRRALVTGGLAEHLMAYGGSATLTPCC